MHDWMAHTEPGELALVVGLVNMYVSAYSTQKTTCDAATMTLNLISSVHTVYMYFHGNIVLHKFVNGCRHASITRFLLVQQLKVFCFLYTTFHKSCSLYCQIGCFECSCGLIVPTDLFGCWWLCSMIALYLTPWWHGTKAPIGHEIIFW